jgi:hypothetical protein
MRKLLDGKRIAMVSGTNGRRRPRTSSPPPYGPRSASDGDRMVHNADGANLHHGIASALSERPAADIAILETDERVVADMIRIGRPEVLVLLNFSRDQLDRHHEIKGLGRSWRDALTAAGADGPVVVANADEPLVVWAQAPGRSSGWTPRPAGPRTPPKSQLWSTLVEVGRALGEQVGDWPVPAQLAGTAPAAIWLSLG